MDAVKSLAALSATGNEVDPFVDDTSISRIIVLALQHVLVFYATAVLVPIVIGRSLGLPHSEIVYLISADLLACGVATLVQSAGIWRFGARMPVVHGLASFGIPVAISIAKVYGLPTLFGSVITSGIAALLIVTFGARVLKLFPRIVVGIIILAVGINLVAISLQQIAGNPAKNPMAGSPQSLAIGFGVIFVIVLLQRTARGWLRTSSVLVGMLLGAGAAAFLGLANFAQIGDTPWVTVITPFHFGLPHFAFLPFLMMLMVCLVALVETISAFSAVEEIAGVNVSCARKVDGLRVVGLATIFSGMFNALPYSVYLSNIALISITGVRNRRVTALAGIFMMALGFLPKFASFFEAVPDPVIGGTALLTYGMLTVAGLRMISKTLRDDNQNALVAAISLAIGLSAVFVPKMFDQVPQISFITGNVIFLTACIAVVANLTLNGWKRGTEAEH